MLDVLFYVGKLLQEAIYPTNLAILCFAASLLFIWRNRRKTALGFQAAGLLVYLVPSAGFVSEALMAPLESAYPPKFVDLYEPADFIVVLGGTTAPLRSPRLEAEEPFGARVQTAARLFRAGKAPKILVSGGSRYRIGQDAWRLEAEDMRDVLVQFGVPQSAIVMEHESRNTYENAVFTARMLKEQNAKRILLVTSGLHMPRAAALFRKQGVEFEAAPCSFLSGARHGIISGAKPHPSNLLHSEAAIKEYVGRLTYWLLGKA